MYSWFLRPYRLFIEKLKTMLRSKPMNRQFRITLSKFFSGQKANTRDRGVITRIVRSVFRKRAQKRLLWGIASQCHAFRFKWLVSQSVCPSFQDSLLFLWPRETNVAVQYLLCMFATYPQFVAVTLCHWISSCLYSDDETPPRSSHLLTRKRPRRVQHIFRSLQNIALTMTWHLMRMDTRNRKLYFVVIYKS